LFCANYLARICAILDPRAVSDNGITLALVEVISNDNGFSAKRFEMCGYIRAL